MWFLKNQANFWHTGSFLHGKYIILEFYINFTKLCYVIEEKMYEKNLVLLYVQHLLKSHRDILVFLTTHIALSPNCFPFYPINCSRRWSVDASVNKTEKLLWARFLNCLEKRKGL